MGVFVDSTYPQIEQMDADDVSERTINLRELADEFLAIRNDQYLTECDTSSVSVQKPIVLNQQSLIEIAVPERTFVSEPVHDLDPNVQELAALWKAVEAVQKEHDIADAKLYRRLMPLFQKEWQIREDFMRVQDKRREQARLPPIGHVISDSALMPPLPDFDPSDQKLSELKKQFDAIKEEQKPLQVEFSQQYGHFYQKESEARQNFLNKFGERRIEELHSRVAEDIDLSHTRLSISNFPAIDGSAHFANLARLATYRILDIPHKWTAEAVKAGYRCETVRLQVVADGENADAVNEFLRNFEGTHQAYLNLIGNERVSADLIIVDRQPAAEELAFARLCHVELDVRPIALDALVLLVNRKWNPVRNLSIEHVLEIYDPHVSANGRFMQTFTPDRWWTEFGVPHQFASMIAPYEQDRNSGSRELMDDFLAKHRQAVQPGQMILRIQSTHTGRLTNEGYWQGAALNVHSHGHGNAIAYSSYHHEYFMQLLADVRMISVEGVAPSTETIRNRTYPITTEVFVVTKKGMDEDSPAVELRNFLLSDAGQCLVYAAGFVPIAERYPAD